MSASRSGKCNLKESSDEAQIQYHSSGRSSIRSRMKSVYNMGQTMHALYTPAPGAQGDLVSINLSILSFGLVTSSTGHLFAAKFIIGTTSALPACSLCINRRIYKMLSTNTFPITRKERIRVLTEELAIGLGIPIVHMILHYVPQDHAFDILEDIGCYPLPYHNTWVTFVLYSTWPLALGTISAVYGIMNLVIINKPSSRTRFFLSKDNKSMDWSRYWRLTLLACLKILASVGICVYLMYSSINEIEMWPWISWSNTHAEFSRIRQIPTSVWRSWPTAKCFELSRWSPALCAFIYLAIFGTCSEARKTYRSVYGSVLLFKRRYHTRGEATDAAQSVVEDPRPESHLHPPRHSTVSSVVLDITSGHVAANMYAQP
ncbi:putative STE3-like pheromone receptor STE3_Mr9 [Moniliophthora roreri]|nr:putative STE3-like pheromone receptor STE3_Mr9 [Moniliophthora roreri]